MTPRQKSKEKGLKTYQGRPCSKCGSTLRRVINSNCHACIVVRIRKSRKEQRRERAAAEGRTIRKWVRRSAGGKHVTA